MSTKRPSIVVLSDIIQKYVGSDFDTIEELAANLDAILATTGLTLEVDYDSNGFPQTNLGDLLEAITSQVNENTIDLASLSTLNDAVTLNADSIAALLADLAFIDANLTTGRLYQGGYDANTNTPDLENPTFGTILKGYSYDVTVAGTFNLDDGTIALNVGDNIRAVIDNPANVADWVQVPVTLNAASIKTQYESNADTNAFDDAAQTKLAGIETGATADLTGAEIVTLYEAEADTWQTGTDRAKLDGIEAGAKDDQTAAEVPFNDAVALTGYTTVQDVIENLDERLDGIEDGFPAISVTYSNTTSGIASANAQGAIDILDNRLDTAETKLAGIEAGADVTDATNVNAAGAVMNSDSSTAAMGFVIDEDDMISDSATKVPTQQSVKAYVDNIIGGAGDKVVWVNDVSDLPVPSGGIITLVANTTYMITDQIALGTDRIQLANNCALIGTNPKYSQLTYTGTGNMFTATAGITFTIWDMYLSATSGALFSLSGGSGETCYLKGVTVLGQTNASTISSWSTFFWDSGAFVNVGAGMVFSGTASTCIIELVEFIGWDNSTSAIDLGLATFNTLTFWRCGFTGGGTGQYGIDKTTGNSNMNAGKVAKVQDCTFGTALTGGILNYDSGDEQWHYHDNVGGGVGDTAIVADFTLQDNGAATTISFVATPYLVNGITWAANQEKQWTVDTVSNKGRATYDGEQDIVAHVKASIFASTASGSNQKYYFYIAKNGTVNTASRSTREFDSTDPGSLSLFADVEVSKGDYLELYVEKADGSTINITIVDAHLIISD